VQRRLICRASAAARRWYRVRQSGASRRIEELERKVGQQQLDLALVHGYAVGCKPNAARVIIPPRSTAILSETGTTQRDGHLRSIEQYGRLGWQRRSGYGRRSLVETAMYRYKTIIRRRLYARTLPNQQIEAKIGCNVLNRMTSLGMPDSVRVK
jgi:hypothetical protein